MPKSRWIYAAAWLVIGLTAKPFAATNAVSPNRSNFNIKHWDTDNRLPENAVIAMTQSRDGYLWLGTINGLARFDGIRFTTFNAFNTPGLGSSPIVFLFADSHGNLWVGTELAGAVLIKDGKVKPLDIGSHSREGRLVAACEDAGGSVWLCTANGQLCRYRNGDVSVWQMRSPKEVGEYRALAVEADGLLWIGADHLLSQIDSTKIVPGQSLPAHREFIVGKLDSLLAGSRGGVWLLANGRVQKYRANQIERDFGLYPWTTSPVLAVCEDHHGNLIVGTQDRAVTWFDADGRSESVTSKEGLSHNTVLSLCMDREGSLWVGTDGGGLNRVTRRVFDTLDASRGMNIKSVCEDDEGRVWFGTFGGGLRYWRDGRLSQIGSVQGVSNFFMGAVYVETNQTVWAGVLGYGLFRFQDGTFSRAAGADQLNPTVSVLHQDHSGRLWVGTEGGLWIRDGQVWTNYLSADAVHAVVDDALGNLWVGTGNGLRLLRHGQFTSFHVKDGLPSEDVSALLVGDGGVLWVGTRANGLARFANGKWTRYTTDNGLTDNSINYLAEDRQGYLWIGSFTGLMRVSENDLNEFAQGNTAAVRCRTYGSADGLPTAECSYGSQPAVWRTGAGKLWFSTSGGLVSVDPVQLMRNTNPPPVMIESVLVDDQLQNSNRLRSNWPKTLTIPAGKERLDIRYTSLNLLAPDLARFKYWMEGLEKNWSPAGDVRVASYRKLPPGNYLFHVTACNEDGVWNPVGASLAITVLPPFWQTWWFRGVFAACLLGIIIATVHYISTQKLQRQLVRLKQQEALERERGRIARDLHDQLGANLTQVSLLGEMVEADKDSPQEVEQHAKQISQTARSTANALDEIVWAANPSNDTLEGLVTYACKYAQEYLALAGVSCRLEVPEELPSAPLPPDVRHNVFLAFKEAVNNVVKHAYATSARVRLLLDADRFSFEIEDNGRGLTDADQRKGRNGLRNMRKRMEDVGGEFAVGPAAEHGTRVRLTARIKRN